MQHAKQGYKALAHTYNKEERRQLDPSHRPDKQKNATCYSYAYQLHKSMKQQKMRPRNPQQNYEHTSNDKMLQPTPGVFHRILQNLNCFGSKSAIYSTALAQNPAILRSHRQAA